MEGMFDCRELYERVEAPTGCNVSSTNATKVRWAELKRRKLGTHWQEGHSLYRRGNGGVTVFDVRKFGQAFQVVAEKKIGDDSVAFPISGSWLARVQLPARKSLLKQWS